MRENSERENMKKVEAGREIQRREIILEMEGGRERNRKRCTMMKREGGKRGMERVHLKNTYVRGKLLAFTIAFSWQLRIIRGTFSLCTFINMN